MIRHVITAIDASPSASAALSIACSVAGLADAHVTGLLVHDERRLAAVGPATALASSIGAQPISESPLPAAEVIDAIDAMDATATQLKNAFSNHCEHAHVRGTFVSEQGIPEDVITRFAKTADLVVIGNSGRHEGIHNASAGMTTNALLHKTTRPVLVVPEDPKGTETIVVAYDASPASERALRAAAECASVMSIPNVHLLTVGPRETATADQDTARTYLSHYDLHVRCEIRSGAAGTVISEYAESVGASIIALGAFGASRVKEFLFGSTTLQTLQNAPAAVLLTA